MVVCVCVCVSINLSECLLDVVVANVRYRVGPGAEFKINMFDRRQEFGYNFGATILYFTAFIVQLSIWGPASTISLWRSSNVAAGVSLNLINNTTHKHT